MAPLPVIAVATFRNQTVNVRIPFKIPAKSMKNHNVTRSKILGFVHFKEHAGNNAGNRMKKARKQRSVLKDMEVERSIEYLLPQVGQKRLWQRKGTNLSFPQCGQPYIAPPKEGSPQLIIFSIFSISEDLG